MTPSAASRGEALAWWQRRSLIAKFAAILLVCGIVSVPAIYGAMQALLAPTFAEIEKQAVHDQAARARHALAVYRDNMLTDVSACAVWDDSCSYLGSGHKAF